MEGLVGRWNIYCVGFFFFFAVGDLGPISVPLINAFTTLFEVCFAWVVQLEFFSLPFLVLLGIIVTF